MNFLQYIIGVSILGVFLYIFVRGMRASLRTKQASEVPLEPKREQPEDTQHYLNDKIMVYLYLGKHPDHTPEIISEKLHIPVDRVEYLCKMYSKF